MTAQTAWKPTEAQRALLRKVVSRHRSPFARDQWYRAESHGERVTRASLHTRGLLVRRAWRGVEGEADAAHEYAPAAELLEALR
jgi:hypothetical protein